MSASQSAPLSSLPVEHMRPEAAYVRGYEDCLRERDEGERRHDDEVLSRYQRELDRLLDRVEAIGPPPEWRPREADDLTAVADAVGVLEAAA